MRTGSGSLIAGVVFVAGVACLLPQAGCGSKQKTNGTVAAPAAGAAGESVAMACPANVPGVQIDLEENEAGSVIVFHVASDRVAEVQRRIAEMELMRQRQPVAGGLTCCRGGGMPDADVTAENTEDGARLSFTAMSAGEVDALHGHLRAQVDRMLAGECPMIEATTTATQ